MLFATHQDAANQNVTEFGQRSSKRSRGKKRDRHEVWGESGEEGGEEVEGGEGEERAAKRSRLTWSKAVRSRDTRRQYVPLHFLPSPPLLFPPYPARSHLLSLRSFVFLIAVS